MRDPRTDNTSLPAPSGEERAHSETLTHTIRAEIERAGGAIDFARFMELALYAPGLGYYSSGRQQFGERGDFVTAPEISPLFARCLARTCAQVLGAVPQGAILEAGAGSGVLAAGLLAELEALDALPERYLILELSTALRARQAECIQRDVPHLAARVQWLDRLPAQFRGLVLGNEVLDAMPVARFVMTEEGPHRLGVAWAGDGFVWRLGDPDVQIATRVAPYALPAGYTSEVNQQAEGWVRTVGALLERGVVLLIDYGFPRAEFYHPERTQGTLMCHYRHRAHGDPLILVGLQDITAHVDFTAVAEAGVDSGLSVLGYTSQAAFLLSAGLADAVNISNAGDTRTHLALTAQVKKLTLPSEMGELFKVIALTRGVRGPLPGFTLQDRRDRL